MLSAILDEMLGPHSKVSVLRVLFKDDDLSGREVARRAGLSPRAASQALARLVRLGVVRMRPAGGAHLFSINRQRFIVRHGLGRLFLEEEGLPRAIGDRIGEIIGDKKCVSVAIFGSYARGEGGVRSDLDILVLLDDPRRVPETRESLERHAEKFHDAFGLRLSPYVIGAAEFAARFEGKDKLMRAMVKEARIIRGKPLAEVLIDESQEKEHKAGN